MPRPSQPKTDPRPMAAALVVLLASAALAAVAETEGERFPETAIVFTGQFNRIERGLELLENGQIERLFISGVNSGAGINVDTFNRQFQLSPELNKARRQGRLVLGTAAQTTLENSAETACWFEREGISGEILLITSNRHLARAIAALENAAPHIKVIGLGVTSPRQMGLKDRVLEFGALVLTRLLGHWPGSLPVREELAECIRLEFR